MRRQLNRAALVEQLPDLPGISYLEKRGKDAASLRPGESLMAEDPEYESEPLREKADLPAAVAS